MGWILNNSFFAWKPTKTLDGTAWLQTVYTRTLFDDAGIRQGWCCAKRPETLDILVLTPNTKSPANEAR